MSDVAFGLNPFEPGYYDDPYRQYAQLREHDPVHRSDLGPWLITRWAGDGATAWWTSTPSGPTGPATPS